MRRAGPCVACVLAAVGCVRPAFAGDELPSWARSEARPFVATRAEAGSILRGTCDLGFGKPFWTWVGVETQALSSTESTTVTGTLTGYTPIASVYLGARHWWSHGKGWLPAAAEYSAADLDHRVGPRVDMTTLLGSAKGWIPMGRFGIPLEANWTYRLDGPFHQVFFDEPNRVIATGRQLWEANAGLAASLDARRTLWVSAQGEWLHVPSRSEGTTLRVGPAAFYAFNERWDVGMLFLFAVYSPDRLGFVSAATGAAVVRWSWATGVASR